MSETGIIIAGFHHSGTRLVARMLSAMGVYQVVDDPTHEWTLVQRMNERLCPAWCEPEGLAAWLDRAGGGEVDAGAVAAGLREAGYAGGMWGVKDPRLCLTASSWCRAFPGAKLVFIYRDPLTVLGTFPAGYAFFTPGKEKPSARLDFWSRLYELYYIAMRRECLRGADVIELRYEDLVADPAASLTRLAVRLGVERVGEAVAAAVRDNPIDPRRVSRLKDDVGSGRVDESGLGLIRRRLGAGAAGDGVCGRCCKGAEPA